MGIISTTVPAPRRAVVTVAILRQELGDKLRGKNDAQVETLAAQITSEIEGYLGRVLAVETVIQREYLAPGQPMYLERRPVLSIVSAMSPRYGGSGTVLDAGTWTLENAELGRLMIGAPLSIEKLWDAGLIGSGEGSGRELYGWSRAAVLEERYPYEVEYRAGWILPGWPGDPPPAVTMPDAVKHAAILLARHKLGEATRPLGVSAMRLGDLSMTFARAPREGESALPAPVKSLLSPYRSAPF